MTVIAHISDLHFGRESPDVATGLLTSLAEQNPQVVVISGDLTQRAKTREYVAAANFIRQINTNCLIVPGNHDLTAFNLFERFIRPWNKWKRIIDENLQPTLRTPEALLVGVNTARKWASLFDFSRGRISRQQINRVLQSFEGEAEHKLRILIAHHPFWLPDGQKNRGLIGHREAAVTAFTGGGIDLILSGHVHLPYWQIQQGMIISHAGTSSSDRLLPGCPNSYKLIRGNRSELTISLFVWDGDRFNLNQNVMFKRDSRGWTSTKVENR